MSKQVTVIASNGMESTMSERLPTDYLRIECTKRVVTTAGTMHRINLTVHNGSTVGRMARVLAVHDQLRANVIIDTPVVYVAPNGSTTIQAVIQPLIGEGLINVEFKIAP